MRLPLAVLLAASLLLTASTLEQGAAKGEKHQHQHQRWGLGGSMANKVSNLASATIGHIGDKMQAGINAVKKVVGITNKDQKTAVDAATALATKVKEWRESCQSFDTPTNVGWHETIQTCLDLNPFLPHMVIENRGTEIDKYGRVKEQGNLYCCPMHPLAQELGCKIRFNPTASKYGGSRNLPGYHVTLKHAAMCDMDQGYSMSAKDLYSGKAALENQFSHKPCKRDEECRQWQNEKCRRTWEGRYFSKGEGRCSLPPRPCYESGECSTIKMETCQGRKLFGKGAVVESFARKARAKCKPVAQLNKKPFGNMTDDFLADYCCPERPPTVDAPTYEFRSPTMIRKLLKNFDEINLWQMERMHSSYDARAPERQKCIEHPEPAWSGKKKSRGDKNGFPVLHLTDWLVPVAGGFYVARGEYDPDSLKCKEGLRPLEFFWTTLKSRLLEFAKRMLLQFNVKQFRVMEIVDQPIWISREEADAFQKEYINPFMPGNSYVSEVLKKLENKTIDCREQPAAMGCGIGVQSSTWARKHEVEIAGNKYCCSDAKARDIVKTIPKANRVVGDAQKRWNATNGWMQTDEAISQIAFRGFGQLELVAADRAARLPAPWTAPRGARFAIDLSYLHKYKTRPDFDRYGAIAYFNKHRTLMAIWHCQYNKLMVPFGKTSYEEASVASWANSDDSWLPPDWDEETVIVDRVDDPTVGGRHRTRARRGNVFSTPREVSGDNASNDPNDDDDDRGEGAHQQASSSSRRRRSSTGIGLPGLNAANLEQLQGKFVARRVKPIKRGREAVKEAIMPSLMREDKFEKTQKARDAGEAVASEGYDNVQQMIDHYAEWEHAKWAFKSSLIFHEVVPVHLVHVHWIVAGTMAQARRETLSRDHPLRRFLRPYTFGTIMINWAAHTTLEGEGNAAHRRSGLTEEALTNLFNVYPMTRFKYDSWYNWVKSKGLTDEEAGTLPMVQDGSALWDIYYDFAEMYIRTYWRSSFEDGLAYGTDAALNSDPELVNFWHAVQHYHRWTLYELPPLTLKALANYLAHVMFTVTAHHEMVGNVADYTRMDGCDSRIYKKAHFLGNGHYVRSMGSEGIDPKFKVKVESKDKPSLPAMPHLPEPIKTTFSKEFGKNYGHGGPPTWCMDLSNLIGSDVVAATTQAKMPKILETNITNVFLRPGKDGNMEKLGDASEKMREKQFHEVMLAYNTFNTSLAKLAEKIDKRNRNNQNMWFDAFNPRLLEYSVSL